MKRLFTTLQPSIHILCYPSKDLPEEIKPQLIIYRIIRVTPLKTVFAPGNINYCITLTPSDNKRGVAIILFKRTIIRQRRKLFCPKSQTAIKENKQKK